jgi:metal-responsive CopG/Arc/MetJ family transcriptional regulator
MARKYYDTRRCATVCYTDGMKPEKTVVLSFRLPERLVKRIDALADAETRNRVNMVQVLLQEALDSREQSER